MKRLAAVAAGLLVACAWSNSLYQARLLSGDAVRAERDHQPAAAQSLWGQVVDRAESAYARSPRGTRGAEALWLAGHAAARSHDCTRAIVALQGSLLAARHQRWEQELLLDLAGCEEGINAAGAVSSYDELLAEATDPGIRRVARMRQGHVLLALGQWQRAVTTLAGEDSLPARLDRATALAHLDRTSEALAELAPAFAAADLTVRWLDYVELFAVQNSAAADTLLDRVIAFPKLPATQRQALILAAAKAALTFDPDAADRRLRRFAAGSGTGIDEGRLLQMRLRLSRPATPAQLRGPVDSISQVDFGEAGVAGRRVAELARVGRSLIAQNDSLRAGAPRGDLVMFALAAAARDSLGAVRLGSWFFARLERDWPQSPYVAKALFARAALEPDSGAALIARASSLRNNPYIAAANGDAAGRVRVPQLEDSLDRFIARLWASRPAAAAVTEHL